jgi:Flp pilus assembly protein TadG
MTETITATSPFPRKVSRPIRRMVAALRGDSGAVTAELAIVTPAVLTILLLIVQFALWSHATHIAQAAASQGLAALRVQEGTVDLGTARARSMIQQLAGGPLTDAVVTAERTPTVATIRVSGVVAGVVPLLRLPVHAEAAGSVERFVPAGG